MTTNQPRRSLKNMRLTRKFHFRYLGLWIFICLALLFIINVLIYMLLRQRWINLQLQTGLLLEDVPVLSGGYLLALTVEALLFAGAIVFLAMTTAHRIAGPYIRLQNVFQSVRDGNLNQTLKFRAYDRLEDVEQSFNQMMETVRQRLPKT